MEKLDCKRGSKTIDIQPKGQRRQIDQAEDSVNLKSTLKASERSTRWQALHSHLDTALHQWNEISAQMQGELSPDQKQLQEVKSLLQQLKTKLEQF